MSLTKREEQVRDLAVRLFLNQIGDKLHGWTPESLANLQRQCCDVAFDFDMRFDLLADKIREEDGI